MTLKAIMVDVDGVLVVHQDGHGGSDHLERDLGISPALLQEAFFKQHFADVVHGRAPLRERLEPVLRTTAPAVSCEQLIEYWFAHDATLNVELLRELEHMRRSGIELHLATVQEHERAAYLWTTLGLRDHFDAIHYAGDIGWAKPAPEFYAAVEQRTGFGPHEIFFIDDSPANVAAASVRGWTAALWTGRQTLASLMDRPDDRVASRT